MIFEMRSRVAFLLLVLLALIAAVILYFASRQDAEAPDVEQRRSAPLPGSDSATPPSDSHPPRAADAKHARALRAAHVEPSASEQPSSEPPSSAPSKPQALEPWGVSTLAGVSLLVRNTKSAAIVAVHTDADGRFEIPANLEDVPYDVMSIVPAGGLYQSFRTALLRLPGHVRLKDLREGAHEFEETPGAHVAFRCTDETGQRLDCRIDVTLAAGDVETTPQAVATVASLGGFDGTLDLPGAWAFTAVLDSVPVLGAMPAIRSSQSFTSPAVGQSSVVEFHVVRTAELTVALIDEKEARLPNVFVYSKTYRDEGIQIQAFGSTGDDGSVVLSKLQPGESTVLVCAVARPAVVQHVGLVAGEKRLLTIEVPSGGATLGGRLTGVSAAQVAQVNLAYRSAPVADAFTVTIRSVADDGRFEFVGLKAGEYDLHLILKDGGEGFRRIRVDGMSTDLGDVDVGALSERGEFSVSVTASVPRWRRGYYWGQYHRLGWPDGLWRFVRLDDSTPTTVRVAAGTYTFRMTPESNATDGFNAVVAPDIVVGDAAKSATVTLRASPSR